MNTLFLNLKKSTKHLSYPFMFSAIFLITGGIIISTPLAKLDGISRFFDNYTALICNSLIIGFIVHYECRNSKKSIIAVVSYVICDIAFFCFGGYHFGLIFTVIISFITSRILKGLNLIYGYIIMLLSALIFSTILGIAYPVITDTLMAISQFFSNKGALFGAVNNFYEIIFGNNLGELFYNNDYTGAMLINNEIITGVKNIFEHSTDKPYELVSKYLAGKYFANIFIPAGAYICIYKKLDKNELNAITLCLVLSVIFGNNLLFYAFVFLFNPFVYVGCMLSVFAGYLIAELIDIRCGYLHNGSVIELIRFGDKWIYFLLCGFVLAIMSYFITRLLISRFDIRGTKILPRDVRSIVASLGGEENIERIANNKLYVKNPNLINILKIDCDIHENEVTMIYDELELLKEYF